MPDTDTSSTYDSAAGPASPSTNTDKKATEAAVAASGAAPAAAPAAEGPEASTPAAEEPDAAAAKQAALHAANAKAEDASQKMLRADGKEVGSAYDIKGDVGSGDLMLAMWQLRADIRTMKDEMRKNEAANKKEEPQAEGPEEDTAEADTAEADTANTGTDSDYGLGEALQAWEDGTFPEFLENNDDFAIDQNNAIVDAIVESGNGQQFLDDVAAYRSNTEADNYDDEVAHKLESIAGRVEAKMDHVERETAVAARELEQEKAPAATVEAEPSTPPRATS